MRQFVSAIAKLFIKLLAIVLSPVMSLFMILYHIAVAVLSYGLIGLVGVCLFAAGAEFVSRGVTQDSITYIGLAIGVCIIRWLIMQSVYLLQWVQGYLDAEASSSVFARYGDDQFDDDPYTSFSYL